MPIKGYLFSLYARYRVAKNQKSVRDFEKSQERIFKKLIQKNAQTEFGKLYKFDTISDYGGYASKVPLSTYESMKAFIEKINEGQKNVLTTEPIKYFLKTSGTTSGSKYIPLTLSGLKAQIDATNLLLCHYVSQSGNHDILNHKMIFIQGSPELDNEYSVPSGRLSGIVYHHIPKFFQKNKLPSYKINIITDWQEKIQKIVEETVNEDISVIGGIPPWCIQYFELLLEKSGKKNLKEIFPNLKLYIHGGVDFTTYRDTIERLLGKEVDILETYPASEGFFGIQDDMEKEDLQVLTDKGVFYECIPFEEVHQENPKAIPIDKIKKDKNYELVVSTVSGLWRYRTGDLVKFTKTHQPRVKVVGRTSQFISAFGEHIILSEIEYAMREVSEKFNLDIREFLVSPNVKNKYYEWRVESSSIMENKEEIENYLDEILSQKNSYYQHLIAGNIINKSFIIPVSLGTFERYRQSIGKSGGQFKIVKIENSRHTADEIDTLF